MNREDDNEDEWNGMDWKGTDAAWTGGLRKQGQQSRAKKRNLIHYRKNESITHLNYISVLMQQHTERATNLIC